MKLYYCDEILIPLSVQAAIISAIYYILAQFGEPANRRQADLFSNIFITNRQGIGNPLDLVFGLLDGVLSYSSVLRTIVFYSLGVRSSNIKNTLKLKKLKIGKWNNHLLADHVNLAKQSAGKKKKRSKQTKYQEEKWLPG